MTDLVTAVLAAADAHPDQPALTSARTTISYRELAQGIRATASGLRAEGMQHGDRVLFSVRPGPDAVRLALGIVLGGGVVVFADPGAGEALFTSRTRLAAPGWVAAESLLYLASSRPLRPIARRRGLELAPYQRDSSRMPGTSMPARGCPAYPVAACPCRRVSSAIPSGRV